MIVYKICLVDDDGRLILSRRRMCYNEGEALMLARRMVKNMAHAEVWRGSTLVGCIFPNTDRANRVTPKIAAMKASPNIAAMNRKVVWGGLSKSVVTPRVQRITEAKSVLAGPRPIPTSASE